MIGDTFNIKKEFAPNCTCQGQQSLLSCLYQRNGEYTQSTTDFYLVILGVDLERKRANKGGIIYGTKLKETDFID